MRIFFSTGEASGESYAVELAKVIGPGHDLSGIGGERLKSAGVKLIADSSRWGAISIVQSLVVARRVIAGYRKAKKELETGTPGVFVAIDFGYVNVRLLAHAKKYGWKTVYLIPPGSWKRDFARTDVVAAADEVVVPFEWAVAPYQALGASVHWFGHPLKQILKSVEVKDSGRSGIAVLPGSRSHELTHNIPLIQKILKPDEKAKVAVVSQGQLADVKRLWKREGDAMTVGNAREVLASSKVGLVCSGTATLEAAMMRCPTVVLYRASHLMYLEARLVGFKRPKFIAAPNIILDRLVMPEFLHLEATPENIRPALEELLTDGTARAAQLEGFDEINAALGPDDALTRTAELILSLSRV